MKPYQIFARMEPEQAVDVLNALLEAAPGVYTQAIAVASATMKARPKFLMKQTKEKRAHLIRRALSRVAAGPIAEEVLAAYFLDTKKDLLVEWLDQLGLEHEEGILKQDRPESPAAAALEEAVAVFRKGEDPADRELLLQAFSAQSSLDWPALNALLEPEAGGDA
jgi:hypothetical protein